MDNFRAYRIDEDDGKVVAGFQELSIDDLTEGNVVIKVSHSTINYKDALAATGAGRILRSSDTATAAPRISLFCPSPTSSTVVAPAPSPPSV